MFWKRVDESKILDNYKLDPSHLPTGTIISLKKADGCSGELGIVCEGKLMTVSNQTPSDEKVKMNSSPIAETIKTINGHQQSCIQNALIPSEWIDIEDLNNAITASGSTSKNIIKAK
jgi:hypothetical protein